MFPCHPGGPPEGKPRRAQHCTCPRRTSRGRCFVCGKLPERTIADTHDRQRLREARGQRDVQPALRLLTRSEGADAAALARTAPLPERRAA